MANNPWLEYFYPKMDRQQMHEFFNNPELIKNFTNAAAGTPGFNTVNRTLPMMKSGYEGLMNPEYANAGKVMPRQESGYIGQSINNTLRDTANEAIPSERQYYRGTPYFNEYENLSQNEIAELEKKWAKNDVYLGKGHWYADDPEMAKRFGSKIEKTKGNFDLYDLSKNIHDPVINDLMNGIKRNTPNSRSNIDQYFEMIQNKDNFVNQLHQELKNRGYQGIRRRGLGGEESHYMENMFFEKPLVHETETTLRGKGGFPKNIKQRFDSNGNPVNSRELDSSYVYDPREKVHLNKPEMTDKYNTIRKRINESNQYIKSQNEHIEKYGNRMEPEVINHFKYNIGLTERQLKDHYEELSHYQDLLKKFD